MKERSDCSFRRCSAPLCPLNEESLTKGIWYPGESICRNEEFIDTPMVKNQMKAKRCSDEFYFTAPMLECVKMVSKDLKGLDPDVPEDKVKSKEQRWINRERKRKEENNHGRE